MADVFEERVGPGREGAGGGFGGVWRDDGVAVATGYEYGVRVEVGSSIRVPFGEQPGITGEVGRVHLLCFVHEVFEIRWDAGTHYAFESPAEATTVVAVTLRDVVQVSWTVEAVEGCGTQEEHGGKASGSRDRQFRGYRTAEGVAEKYGVLYTQRIEETGEAPGIAGYRGNKLFPARTLAETGHVRGDEAGSRGRVWEQLAPPGLAGEVAVDQEYGPADSRFQVTQGCVL